MPPSPPHDTRSKLSLKDTPAERARKEERRERRAARQARREARRGSQAASSSTSSSRHHHHNHHHPPKSSSSSRKRRSSPSLSPGPRPPPPSTTRFHESEFDEHLRYLASLDSGPSSAFDAFDFGQDGSGVGWGDAPYDPGSSSAQHVPLRWSSRRAEDNVWNDPLLREPGGLDDDAYAESIRQGMWERKHPGEASRRARLGAEAERTKERLEQARREGEKLERKRIQELEQRKGEQVEEKQRAERVEFDRRWAELVGGPPTELAFVDVPWPVYASASGIRDGSRRRGEERPGVEWMTASSVAEFLLPPAVLAALADDAERKRKRREVLREAIRRYHPDKFTRYLALVPDGPERARVHAGVEQAARVIGALMSSDGGGG